MATRQEELENASRAASVIYRATACEAGRWHGADMTAEPEALEQRRGAFLISTDKARLNVDLICDYLSQTSYWAQGRPHSVILRSIKHSLCLGLYLGDRQIGFARVVTDFATFAWLADLFVLASHRGQGLGRWLIEFAVEHPELQSVKQFMLATRDAQELYRRCGGFEVLPAEGKFMVRLGAERGTVAQGTGTSP